MRKEISKVRNKILFVLSLVLVFTLGVLSVRAWDHYKVSEHIRVQAQEARQQLEVRAAEQKRQAELRAEQEKVQKACQSLVDTYDGLTPSQQAKTTKPDCNLEPVQ